MSINKDELESLKPHDVIRQKFAMALLHDVSAGQAGFCRGEGKVNSSLVWGGVVRGIRWGGGWKIIESNCIPYRRIATHKDSGFLTQIHWKRSKNKFPPRMWQYWVSLVLHFLQLGLLDHLRHQMLRHHRLEVRQM